MKSRLGLYALVTGVLSLASGCHCLRECFPYLGWRLHHGCCGPVCPDRVCTPPVCPAPGCFTPVYRPVTPVTVVPSGPAVPSGPVVPDCPTCFGGDSPGVSPPGPYPPVIGTPMPLPNPAVVPPSHNAPDGTNLPAPTPAPMSPPTPAPTKSGMN